MLSCFHLITACDGQMNRRTDRIAISISHINMLTCEKNERKPTNQYSVPADAVSTLAGHMSIPDGLPLCCYPNACLVKGLRLSCGLCEL